MNPPSTGPIANPIGPLDPEDRDQRAEASERHDVADRGQHHSGVAELEADEKHAQGQLPRLAAERHAGEDDRLDQARSGR